MSTYYVKTFGGTGSGLTDEDAWSFEKFNSIILNPGDIVLFKRDNVFYGTINITSSGLINQNITYSSYGIGKNPIISSLSLITEWNDLGNGIYEASIIINSSNLNMVIFNDKNTCVSRFPKQNYLTITNITGNTTLIDNTLLNTPNWTGAEVVIRKERYIIDISPITYHSGNTITYTPTSPFYGHAGYGYFIQNDPKTLSSFGDWYYNLNENKIQIYFGSEKPLSSNIKIANFDKLLTLSDKQYITIDGLDFEGSNFVSIDLNNYQNIIIKNCNINYSGKIAINGLNGNYLSLINININNSNNAGINLDDTNQNVIVDSCSINNTYLFPGMGGSGSGIGNALTVFGDNSIIRYNTVTNSGGGGISFAGNNTLVQYNYVDTFAFTKDDGGGIYEAFTKDGQKILNNIVLNGIGASGGTSEDPLYYLPTYGIYLDENADGIEIGYNTIANCSESGIMIHDAPNMHIHHNTSYNNNLSQIQLNRDVDNDDIKNEIITNNIFFSKTSTQNTFFYRNSEDKYNSFGVSDNNLFIYPNDDQSSIIKTILSGVRIDYHSLNDWKTVSGQDSNSFQIPEWVDFNKMDILFKYNITKKNISINLGNNVYFDLYGKMYYKRFILLPFQSVILFKNKYIKKVNAPANVFNSNEVDISQIVNPKQKE